MSPDFVQVDIATDSASLLDDGITQINSTLTANGFPGWTADDADLAVIILSTVSQIAADNATVASTLLAAAFRAFGTVLFGIAYQNGTQAAVVSTWTFAAPAPVGGYTIPGGTAVIIDSLAFYVANDVTTGTGDTTASVLLVASDVGIAYNGLGGIGAAVEPSDQIDWVLSITTTAATSGGVDQEDDLDYENRLANALQLITPRPITASNFADLILSDFATQATGITVGRATSIDGYYPAARTLSGGGTGPTALTTQATLTNLSPTVTITTLPVPFAVPAVGATVTGTGIPGSTTVLASPAPTSAGFTLSNNATASGSNTLTITAWTNVERCDTTFVTDANGLALTNAQMDSLQAFLASEREITFLAFVEPPSYTTIYVTAVIHALASFVPSVVATAVQTALLAALSPATWGNPLSASTGSNAWQNSGTGFNVVRENVLIGLAQGVPGVQYVSSLKLGIAPSPAGTVDVTLVGPAPLPLSDNTTILVTTV